MQTYCRARELVHSHALAQQEHASTCRVDHLMVLFPFDPNGGLLDSKHCANSAAKHTLAHIVKLVIRVLQIELKDESCDEM